MSVHAEASGGFGEAGDGLFSLSLEFRSIDNAPPKKKEMPEMEPARAEMSKETLSTGELPQLPVVDLAKVPACRPLEIFLALSLSVSHTITHTHAQHAHTHTHTHAHTHTQTHTHTHAHMHTLIHALVQAHIPIRIRTHTFSHSLSLS